MIKPIQAFELYCDKCGKPFLNEYERTYFDSEIDGARAYAECNDWQFKDGKDYCEECADVLEAKEE